MSGRNETQLGPADNRENAQYKWICYALAAEGVIGVLGNLLVCFVILRVKFLHDMTNYLLVNLAVADMLLCLQEFFLYFAAYSKCEVISYVPKSAGGRQIFCRLIASDFWVWAVSHVSAYSLCLVTFERYVAIVHPLQYARKITSSQIARMIAWIWVLSSLVSLPFVFTIEPADDSEQACSDIKYPHPAFPFVVGVFCFLTAYLLPITLMSWAYYQIQTTLKQQADALSMQQVRAAAYDLMIARQRLVSMLTLVLGALVVLWTPTYVITVFCVQSQTGEIQLEFCNSPSLQHIRGACSFLFYLNSLINTIIYEFKYKKFRQGFKEAFTCCLPLTTKDNSVGIQLAHFQDN